MLQVPLIIVKIIMSPSRTFGTEQYILTVVQYNHISRVWITIRFVNLMNQFFHLHCRSIDRADVHFVPCTFGAFKKHIFTVRRDLESHHILVVPFLYICFLHSLFHHINDDQFVLCHIFVTGIFIFVLLQRRLVRQ